MILFLSWIMGYSVLVWWECGPHTRIHVYICMWVIMQMWRDYILFYSLFPIVVNIYHYLCRIATCPQTWRLKMTAIIMFHDFVSWLGIAPSLWDITWRMRWWEGPHGWWLVLAGISPAGWWPGRHFSKHINGLLGLPHGLGGLWIINFYMAGGF